MCVYIYIYTYVYSYEFTNTSDWPELDSSSRIPLVDPLTPHVLQSTALITLHPFQSPSNVLQSVLRLPCIVAAHHKAHRDVADTDFPANGLGLRV